MRTVEQSNQLASSMVLEGKYKYLYGAKDIPYTSNNVYVLASRYPSTFTSTIRSLALEDADKDYMAVDCSGFICKVLGVPHQGSSMLRKSAVRRYPVSITNATPGMALWRNGHIAYVGEDLNVYEARSTKSDLTVSSWKDRAKDFTELLVIKGSALDNSNADISIIKNPYVKPNVLVCTEAKAREKKYSSRKYISRDITPKSMVKWVQYELREAGCKGKDGNALVIDGKFGPNSEYALLQFQKSCKIADDGICGPITISYLEKL